MTDKRKRKTKTATGAALADIAIKLMKNDSTLSFQDAKEKAAEQIKAKQAIEAKQQGLRDQLIYGGRTKKKVLDFLFGHKIGGFLSNRIKSTSFEESIAKKLASSGDEEKEDFVTDAQAKVESKKKRQQPQAEPVSPPHEAITPSEVKAINTKLNTIESTVKAIKAVKVANPTPPKPEPVLKTQEHEDAALGLKALGYKKKEIEEMLKNAAGTTAQEIIKSALKPKKAQRVPVSAVHAAVESVKAEVTGTSIPSPLTPVPRATTDEKIPDSQKEAEDAKRIEAAAEATKKSQKEREEILAKLDEIIKHVKGKGFLDMLADFFKPLLAAVMAPIAEAMAIIAPLLGGLVAIAAAAYAGYKIGQWLDDKFHIHEKVVQGVEGMAQDYLGIASPELSGYAATRTRTQSELQSSINKKLEGTGYKNVGTALYQDASGKQIKASDLPENVKAKIGYPSTATAKISAPIVASASASKIDSASSDNSSMKAGSSAPVIVQNDNRKTIQSSGGGGSGPAPIVAITVRNVEPSVSAYVAGIFNHTVLRLPL
jgi:hypothetical protein